MSSSEAKPSESILDYVVEAAAGEAPAHVPPSSSGGASLLEGFSSDEFCECSVGGGRGRGARGAPVVAPVVALTATPDTAAALAGLTTTPAECAEDVEHPPGSPCATKQVLRAVAAFAAAAGRDAGGVATSAAAKTEAPLLPAAATPEAAAVRAAAAALQCESESCVLAHPSLQQFVVERRLLPAGALDLELETRFKAEGPRDTTALTSNDNLDGTLRRWARVFTDFYPCPYAMMDFERNGDALGKLDIGAVLDGRAPLDLGPGFGVVRRPARCFGCILNTDVKSGRGKHWVAVFVDCRGAGPWTVEYFNSVGSPPPRPVVRWMETTRARLVAWRAAHAATTPPGPVETVAVTDVDHQESQTECGLYALFYIRRRLEATPYSFFYNVIVPDDAMTMFRAHVFRAG